MTMTKKRKKTDSYEEWKNKAIEGCERYPDGSINKTAFLKRLETVVVLDEEKGKKQLAMEVWRHYCNDLLPAEEEQLWLFDNPKPEPYNRNRFVLGPGEISFMPLWQATLTYIDAEARRSRVHAADCLLRSNEKADRASKFQEWTFAKLQQGETTDLGFEHFAIETGILRERPDETEPPNDEDEE